MTENKTCKLSLNKDGIVILQVNDESIYKNTISISGKTFSFSNVENNWSIIYLGSKGYKIGQLKNLQSKQELIGFVNFDFENEYQEILNGNIKFDLEGFEQGLSIFRDFNSDESKILPFVYKLKKSEEEYVKELLNKVYEKENEKVVLKKLQSNGFNYFSYENDEEGVSTLTKKYSYENIENYIEKAIEQNDINKILSFFMGIYVNGFIKVDYSSGIVFQIPLMKSLYLHKTIFYKVFGYLRKYFVFSEDRRSIFQVSSRDGEFDELFHKYLSKVFENTSQHLNSDSKKVEKLYFGGMFTDTRFFRKNILESKREKLFEFFDTIEGLQDGIIFINKVSQSHIKFYMK